MLGYIKTLFLFSSIICGVENIQFELPPTDCTPAFLGAITLFSMGDSGHTVMVVIPTNSSLHITTKCNMGLLNAATVPIEIVTSGGVEDFDFFPRKLIIIVPEDNQVHDFQMFFDQISKISAMSNIFFIATKYKKDHFKTLTGYFAHSMVLLANWDFSIDAYYRPRIFEDKLAVVVENSVDLSQWGEFDHITTDFHGHTIRAVGFDFKPYFVPDFENPENHAGYEYNIASVIFRSLNLNMVVSKPTGPNSYWGTEDPPGSGNYTGLYGDLQRGIAEIGWGNLYSSVERLRFMDFTDWYLVEPTCILMKRPKPKSGIQILVLPLDEVVWLFSALCLLALFGFYLLQYLINSDVAKSWGFLVFYGASVTLRESDPYTHSQNQTISLRLVHFLFIPCLLVLSSAYSGSLISFLSIDVFPPPLQTYDQVAKEVVKKDLNVALCCKEIEDMFSESKQESFQELNKRIYYPQGLNTGFMRTHEGTDIYLYSKNALEIMRRTNSYRVPYNSLYVMKECFLPIYVSLGLKKQSVIRDAINLKMKQLREAGIISKMVNEGHNLMSNVTQVSETGTREVSKDKPLDLKHLQGIFQVLLLVLTVSLWIFAAEFTKSFLNRAAFNSGSTKPTLLDKDGRRRKYFKRKSVFMPRNTYRRGKRKSVFELYDKNKSRSNSLQPIFVRNNNSQHDLQNIFARNNSSSHNLQQVFARRYSVV